MLVMVILKYFSKFLFAWSNVSPLPNKIWLTLFLLTKFRHPLSFKANLKRITYSSWTHTTHWTSFNHRAALTPFFCQFCICFCQFETLDHLKHKITLVNTLFPLNSISNRVDRVNGWKHSEMPPEKLFNHFWMFLSVMFECTQIL